jgi:hypothetical protein
MDAMAIIRHYTYMTRADLRIRRLGMDYGKEQRLTDT